jgi:hypothetical protein
MWSQVDIIKSAINGNDYAVTQTGVDNLLATYKQIYTSEMPFTVLHIVIASHAIQPKRMNLINMLLIIIPKLKGRCGHK